MTFFTPKIDYVIRFFYLLGKSKQHRMVIKMVSTSYKLLLVAGFLYRIQPSYSNDGMYNQKLCSYLRQRISIKSSLYIFFSTECFDKSKGYLFCYNHENDHFLWDSFSSMIQLLELCVVSSGI